MFIIIAVIIIIVTKTPLCPRDDVDKLCSWNKSFQAAILEKWSCDGTRSVLGCVPKQTISDAEEQVS